MKWEIRRAQEKDLDQLTEIYNHYVINTPITFDTTPFVSSQRMTWFRQFNDKPEHLLLVGCLDRNVIGYASSSRLRPKAAYDTSVETTIYLDADSGGQGYGKKLYSRLLEELQQTSVHRCYGIVTLPNKPSLALHASLGFTEAGYLSEVGFKFDKFWDTLWLEKTL